MMEISANEMALRQIAMAIRKNHKEQLDLVEGYLRNITQIRSSWDDSAYNALFEAVSGITTTGATILTDFSAVSLLSFLNSIHNKEEHNEDQEAPGAYRRRGHRFQRGRFRQSRRHSEAGRDADQAEGDGRLHFRHDGRGHLLLDRRA